MDPCPSPQAHNPAEYQHILESSGRRLQWVLDHPDTYWRWPVAFVPAGTGFSMASAELHPEVGGIAFALWLDNCKRFSELGGIEPRNR
jgi:hypothetical protein